MASLFTSGLEVAPSSTTRQGVVIGALERGRLREPLRVVLSVAQRVRIARAATAWPSRSAKPPLPSACSIIPG